MFRRFLLAASLLVVCPLLAHAADQTVLGKQLLVKDPSTPDKRKVILKAPRTRPTTRWSAIRR